MTGAQEKNRSTKKSYTASYSPEGPRGNRTGKKRMNPIESSRMRIESDGRPTTHHIEATQL